MNSNEFIFATSNEIAKTLADRAKDIRVNELKINQVDFAKKIGMSYGKYQRFEQNADIRLEDFITIMRYLNRLDEVGELLEPLDIEALGIEAIRSGGKKKKRVFK